ncbi:MAG: hypothetical protein WC485_09065, partial [Opitutaceae bacterium]
PEGLSRFARYAIDILTTANNAQESEARLPFSKLSLAAVDGASLLNLTDRNTKMNEHQQIAAEYRTALFHGNMWAGIVLILLLFSGGVVLMWFKAPWKKGVKIAITVVLGLMIIMVVAAMPRSNVQQPAGIAVQADAGAAKTPEVVAPPEPKIPKPDFVLERMEACERYKQATNDIKRSEIYTNYFKQTEIKSRQVKDMSGVLKKMATSRGGGIVLLTVDTAVGVFGNNDMMQGGFLKSRREIKKGSKLYNSIGDLTEGQRVTFSGGLIIAEKETTEKMSICGDGFLIKFTEVKAAQSAVPRVQR